MGFFKSVEEKELRQLEKLKELKKKQDERKKAKEEKLKAIENIKRLKASKANYYNQLEKQGLIDFKYWGRKLKTMFSNPSYCVAVFFLDNGKVETQIKEIVGGIVRRGEASYIYDTDYISRHDPTNHNIVFYKENIALPLNIDFDMQQIYDTLKNTDLSVNNTTIDTEIAMNPYSLERYIKSEFIQKAMKGADLGKDLGFIKIFVMLNGLINVGILILLFSQLT